jgi:hypothetical protein
MVAGGPFAQVCTDLLAEGFVISWRDRVRAQVPGKGRAEGKAGVRTKYTLPKLRAQRLGEGRDGADLWGV